MQRNVLSNNNGKSLRLYLSTACLLSSMYENIILYCMSAQILFFTAANKDLVTDRWTDEWMDNAIFTSFSTVFQSYQDDVRLMMKGCVKWNSI